MTPPVTLLPAIRLVACSRDANITNIPIDRCQGTAMTEECPLKTSRKPAWSFLAITLVGIGLLRLGSPDHVFLDDARHYQPPALAELKVTEGSLHMTKRYKGMGGQHPRDPGGWLRVSVLVCVAWRKGRGRL